jgi:hypothetical protein
VSPDVVEHISVPLGFDRRLRGMNRYRSYAAHTRYVLSQRPGFLAEHRNELPALSLIGCKLPIHIPKDPTGRAPLSASRPLEGVSR